MKNPTKNLPRTKRSKIFRSNNKFKHTFRVIPTEEIEANRSNAYTYLV